MVKPATTRRLTFRNPDEVRPDPPPLTHAINVCTVCGRGIDLRQVATTDGSTAHLCVKCRKDAGFP